MSSLEPAPHGFEGGAILVATPEMVKASKNCCSGILGSELHPFTDIMNLYNNEPVESDYGIEADMSGMNECEAMVIVDE